MDETMDNANSTVPGVLQPWGGPQECETLADCVSDQFGNAMPAIKVSCASFDMPELQGSYCSCDYSLGRVGPTCMAATAASRLDLALNASTAVMDATFLVIVFRKFFRARATGKMRANAGLVVTLLGMFTLGSEFVHSTCRALTMAGVGGGAVAALMRLVGMVTLIAPGMALILSFSVWTKLARSRLGKAPSQKGLDTALAVTSAAFGAFQLVSAFSGRVNRAVWSGSLLMGVLAVIYPLSGFLLVRKLSGTGSRTSVAAANRSVVRLRNFIAKVTALAAVNAVLLALLAQAMQVVGITTFEISFAGAIVLAALKVVYCFLAFVMAAFTLNTLLVPHRKATTVVPTTEAPVTAATTDAATSMPAQ